MTTGKNTTRELYDVLYAAYDHFNAELFAGKLPPVMLVLHRKKSAHGYFWPQQWANPRQRGRKTASNSLAEIALNPETVSRQPEAVLSTLVHEMVHHEQHAFGKPGKATPHNTEWAEWMDRVGLTPVGIGKCAGKRTGRTVTHSIDKGGPFDKACAAFLAGKGNELKLAGAPQARLPRKKDMSKVKHTCGECGTNVWGKKGLRVRCCGEELMREVLY